MKTLILTSTFLIFISYSFTQNCGEDYINATTDSIYFHNTIDFLSEIVDCPIEYLPNWDSNCNPPRSITFIFLVEVNCDSNINNVNTFLAEFQYKNKMGKTVVESIDENHLFNVNKECYLEKIIALKKIKPLEVNGIKLNVKIPFTIKLTSL